LGTLLRDLLLIGILVMLFMMVMRPRQFRVILAHARKYGLIYVAAILISAALDLLILRR
jgi:hypothetical protein